MIGNKLRLVSTTSQIEDKIDWVKQVIAKTNENVDEYNRTAPVEKRLKGQTFDEDRANVEMIRGLLRKGFASATR